MHVLVPSPGSYLHTNKKNQMWVDEVAYVCHVWENIVWVCKYIYIILRWFDFSAVVKTIERLGHSSSTMKAP